MSISSSQPILIVFAAGRGSRMSPLTDTTPKPLVIVQDTALIAWNVDPFVPYISAIVVVVGYRGTDIQDFFGESYHGIPVRCVYQDNPKGGTLDALRTAVYGTPSNLLRNGAFVINADDIHGTDRYSHFMQWHAECPDTSSAVVAAEVADAERLKSLGVLTIDTDSYLKNIAEKPQQFVSDLANTGMYYFTHTHLQRVPRHRAVDHISEEFITTDFVRLLASSDGVMVVRHPAPWLVVSTVQDRANAEQAVIQDPQLFAR